jgi:hypothetical protein
MRSGTQHPACALDGESVSRQETFYEVVTMVQPEKRHPPPVILVGTSCQEQRHVQSCSVLLILAVPLVLQACVFVLTCSVSLSLTEFPRRTTRCGPTHGEDCLDAALSGGLRYMCTPHHEGGEHV